MMKRSSLRRSALTVLLALPAAHAQFPGYLNHGLVAVGRVPAASFDARGPGLDTLGGFGSSAFFDATSWSQEAGVIRGTLYGLPDRGFGDGAQDYVPRVQTFSLSITPDYGTGPAGQDGIALVNTASLLLTYGGVNFTGFDAGDSNVAGFPQSTAAWLGGGRRSLDAAGLMGRPVGGVCSSAAVGP